MFKLRSMFGMNKLPTIVDKPFRDHLKKMDDVLTVAIKEASECYYCTGIVIQCPKSNDILLFQVLFEFEKVGTSDPSKAGKERMCSSIYIGHLADTTFYTKIGASKSDVLKAYEQCVCDTYYDVTCQKSTNVFIHQLNDKLVLKNEVYFDFDLTVTLRTSESAKDYTCIRNIILDDLKNCLNIRPNLYWSPDKYELGSGDVSLKDLIEHIYIFSLRDADPPISYHAILLKAI